MSNRHSSYSRNQVARRILSAATVFSVLCVATSASAQYTKVANNGSVLPASAALGSNPTDWACTRDAATGLTWDARPGEPFTWSDAVNVYPKTMNAAARCGFTDWRLPSLEELSTLLLGPELPKCPSPFPDPPASRIDANYFPNTPAERYWSATAYDYLPGGKKGGVVDFCTARYAGILATQFEAHSRLVRGGKLFDALPAAASLCTPTTFDFNVVALPSETTAWVTVCAAEAAVMSVYDGATLLCSTPLASSGTGSCQATFGLSGTRTLRFQYRLDSDTCNSGMRTYIRELETTYQVKSDPAQEQCALGQYISTPATATVCRVCSVCPAGTSSNTTTATSCTDCPAGSFAASPGSASCTALSECAPGSYVATQPTKATDRVCTPCEHGTFSTTPNAATCAEHTLCRRGSYVDVQPTKTADQTCASCAEGTFSAWLDAPACTAVSSCPPGTYVSEQPTESRDRACAPCGSWSFSTTANAADCTVFGSCPRGTRTISSGTSTSDVVCAPIAGDEDEDEDEDEDGGTGSEDGGTGSEGGGTGSEGGGSKPGGGGGTGTDSDVDAGSDSPARDGSGGCSTASGRDDAPSRLWPWFALALGLACSRRSRRHRHQISHPWEVAAPRNPR